MIIRALDPLRLGEGVRQIASRLADGGNMDDVVRRSRVTSDEISNAIHGYGCTLVSPPHSAFEDVTPIAVEGSAGTVWTMDAPLYTLEEGRSDLSMILTMRIVSDQYEFEIDDVRVL